MTGTATINDPATEHPSAPTHDLIRMVPVDASELRTEGDGRTLIGYPIVFNQPTMIRSWEGDFVETIAPGAVKKTLRENGANIKVLFNHGGDPQIGNKPLGKPRVQREDKKGLYVEVPLSETSYNADVSTLIRDGAIDGMSFRFSVIQETWNAKPAKSKINPDGLPERVIKELRLMEYGPVTFPAYQATEIGMRGAEAVQAWQQLPDDKRAEVRRILGLDTGTHTDEAAGTGTSNGPVADNDNDEPVTTTRRARTIQQKSFALRTHGVITHEPEEAT